MGKIINLLLIYYLSENFIISLFIRKVGTEIGYKIGVNLNKVAIGCDL